MLRRVASRALATSSRTTGGPQAPAPQRGSWREAHIVNLHALKVFCEVVRLQSFSRGAAACGISQSAASQIIRHLERELETRLIDRKVRPPRPTPEGEVYYRGSQELLHRHRLIVEEMLQLREKVAGNLRVASIYSVGLHTLTHYTKRFMASNPGTVIRLEYLHPDKVYAAVLNDEADIGVTSYPKLTRGLVVIPWVEEEMVLVCSPEHRLAKKKRIRPADLEGARLVAFDSGLPIRREIDRALKQQQVTVELVGEFDNIETIKQAVELSDAVSILPRPSILHEIETGTLVGLPIDTLELRRPVGIIRKKRKKLTQTAARFIDSLVAGTPGNNTGPQD